MSLHFKLGFKYILISNLNLGPGDVLILHNFSFFKLLELLILILHKELLWHKIQTCLCLFHLQFQFFDLHI